MKTVYLCGASTSRPRRTLLMNITMALQVILIATLSLEKKKKSERYSKKKYLRDLIVYTLVFLKEFFFKKMFI